MEHGELWDYIHELGADLREARRENLRMHKEIAELLAVMDTDIKRLKRLAGDDLRLADIRPLVSAVTGQPRH